MSLNHRTGRLAAATLLAGVALSACAPDLGPKPQAKAIASYATEKSFAAPAAEWPQDAWWKAYGDPQLDQLIDEALAGSPDLALAEARVRAAEIQVQGVRNSRNPTVSGSASIKESAINQSLGLPASISDKIPSKFQPITQAGLNLSYQLDFFGKTKAQLAAATSSAEAARADRAAARLQISTAVAQAYAELARLAADRAAVTEAVRVRQDTLNLVSDRLKNGLETRGEFSQSSAGVASSQADVEEIDRQIGQTRLRIAALMGAGPDRGLSIALPGKVAAKAPGAPQNLAAELLGRRPDIMAARLRAEAASSRIDAAKAAFYPNVDLAASGLLLALSPGDLLSSNVSLIQAGPAATLPIFGGQVRTNYRGSRAEYDAAVASYDQTLTQALREVADAIEVRRSLTVQLDLAKKALGSGEEAYRIARLRYQGGLSPYVNVLTAETSLLTQRRSVADLEALGLAADIALIRALGGGYSAQNPSV